MSKKPVKKMRVIRRKDKPSHPAYSDIFKMDGAKFGNPLLIRFPKDYNPSVTQEKSEAMSLCGQAEDAISSLEARLSKIIRRINSIIN